MTPAYLSITELNQRVATLLERQIPLLWVQGEISNLTRAASGHWYFSLKDAGAQVRAVMFRHKNTLLNWQPREGDAVQAQVLAGLYAARGDFQLTVETMRPAGLGTLFERFLQLKDELAQAGWFDAAHKKSLPKMIKTIGVVTSPQAAALRDVAHTLARRAPHVTLVLYPCLVQGEQAAGQIARQIEAANANTDLDAVLLVRGGGSLEDLWAFNEREVAQAIRASRLPLVCGVGHETDTTIADFVADVRAATPTAAAELISSPSVDEWQAHLTQEWRHLTRNMQASVLRQEQRLDHLAVQLLTPAQRVQQQAQHLAQLHLRLQHHMRLLEQRSTQQLAQKIARFKTPDLTVQAQHVQQLAQRVQQHMTQRVQVSSQRVASAAQGLAQLNPDQVLARGYAYVRAQDGSIVYNAHSLQSGDGMSVQFADGRVIATVNHIESLN
ncbi:MAG: exodeoxyribonuclease VII large subunit [Formosimonas sp.]